MIVSSFYIALILLFIPYPSHASIEVLPCPKFRSRSSCGKLTVPLDHADPSAHASISILYYVLLPSTSIVSDSALVVVPGGPGLGILSQDPERLFPPQVVHQIKRPVILFDPRGTGDESPLNCSLQAKPFSFDLDIFEIRHCLSEIGPEMLHYSTTAIVNDLEKLRVELGFKQLDLFGVSYGALISQAYGVLYPESIRSILLDSPLPLRYKDVYESRHWASYARIYAELNKNNSDFSPAAFRKQVKSVLLRLRRNRALREELGIDGRRLFFMYSLVSQSFPEAIGSAANENNYTGLIQLAKLLEPVVQPVRNFSVAMSQATLCNDLIDSVPWDVRAGFLERMVRLAYDVWRKAGLGAFSPFSLTEGFSSLVQYCAAVPFPQLRGEGLPLDRRAQRDIPVLVLVGDLDAVTPLEDVVDLDAVFRQNVALVHGAGHWVTLHTCGFGLALEFMASGSVSNKSACE